ncbi:hypothetical protein GCM10029992_39650 [Glycomyces albus]
MPDQGVAVYGLVVLLGEVDQRVGLAEVELALAGLDGLHLHHVLGGHRVELGGHEVAIGLVVLEFVDVDGDADVDAERVGGTAEGGLRMGELGRQCDAGRRDDRGHDPRDPCSTAGASLQHDCSSSFCRA